MRLELRYKTEYCNPQLSIYLSSKLMYFDAGQKPLKYQNFFDPKPNKGVAMLIVDN